MVAARSTAGSTAGNSSSARSLLLLRHAAADPGGRVLPDRDRPLTPAGRRAALAVGGYLARAGLAPELVLCSPARRAVETLECVRAAILGSARVEIEDALYLASCGELLERMSGLPEEDTSILVIGHNPGIQQLALSLAVDGDPCARRRMVSGFAPAACAVLRFGAGGWSQLGRGGALADFARPGDVRS